MKVRVLLAASAMLAVTLGGVVATQAGVSATPTVVEHYQGVTTPMAKKDWRGAKVCVIQTPTDAYCFATQAEADAYTAQQVQPAGYNCSGWTQISNEVYLDGQVLEFRDWGYSQNLSNWVNTPWTVESWANANSCPAVLWNNNNGTGNFCNIPANTYITNAYWWAGSIQLYNPSKPPGRGARQC